MKFQFKLDEDKKEFDKKIVYASKKKTIEVTPDVNGVYETEDKETIELLTKKGIEVVKEDKKEVKK